MSIQNRNVEASAVDVEPHSSTPSKAELLYMVEVVHHGGVTVMPFGDEMAAKEVYDAISVAAREHRVFGNAADVEHIEAESLVGKHLFVIRHLSSVHMISMVKTKELCGDGGAEQPSTASLDEANVMNTNNNPAGSPGGGG